MAKIKAADVAKLRKTSGAGMMDCKKALTEADGVFELAIDILRKKGQKLASKRAGREATEGTIVAKTSADNKCSIMVVLNCETDFVAKNEKFVEFATKIVDLALDKKPNNLDELKSLQLEGITIEEQVTNQIGVIGEKIDLSFFSKVEDNTTIAYIHPGNKLASMVTFNKEINKNIAKDVAMQIAAMNPVSIDKNDIPKEVVDKELEIGRDQAIQEGKPEELAKKIAFGRLNKFYKENTLLNQMFIKDNKKTIKEYLKENDKDLTITNFKYFSLTV